MSFSFPNYKWNHDYKTVSTIKRLPAEKAQNAVPARVTSEVINHSEEVTLVPRIGWLLLLWSRVSDRMDKRMFHMTGWEFLSKRIWEVIQLIAVSCQYAIRHHQ